MKNVLTLYTALLLALAPARLDASNHAMERDTVIIELDNGSKIIIYTKNKVELQRLKAYDVNKMIREISDQVKDDDIEFVEIEDPDGTRYLVDDPNVIFGDRERVAGDTIIVDTERLDRVKVRIKSLEVEINPDEITDTDPPQVTKYQYVRENDKGTVDEFKLDIGINNWLEDGKFPNDSDAPYSVKNWGSWHVGLNWVNSTKVAGPLYLEWGGGITWYNWKLEDPGFIIEKGADQIEFNAAPIDVNPQKSKLTATYINASFVPMLDFSKRAKTVKTSVINDGVKFRSYRKSGFRIGAGVYGGFRLSSKSKFVFSQEGNKEKDKVNDSFFLENFRYGIRGQVGYKGLDIFVMYDLNEVFVEGRGPGGASLNAVTVGVTL